MRILAVDTTTERGSVAVVEQGELLGELRLLSAAAHSQRILPAIDFLLGAVGGGLAGIGGYAVALGPGSFTGIRIGISTIQGLALGQPRPCLGVSALDVLAERARGDAKSVVAMIDAWRDEVYAAVYDEQARPVAGPFVEAPGRVVLRAPAGAAYVGAGARRYRERILAHDAGARFPERSLYLAGTLARMAEPRLHEGAGVAPGALRALYVRPPGAAKSTA